MANEDVTASIIAITRRCVLVQEYKTVAQP